MCPERSEEILLGCKNCGHVFQNKSRKKKIETKKLWNEYCFWKQFYKELAEKYWLTIKTI